MIPRYLTDWPGKSPATEGGPAHPAVYHMVDVAAVAELLLAPLDMPAPRKAAYTLLVALHDLGKIGAPFRGMLRTGASQGDMRHWQVTELYLNRMNASLAATLGIEARHALKLGAAIAGHHGRPAPPELSAARPPIHGQPLPYREKMWRAAGPEAQADAAEALAALSALWPDASLAGLREAEAKRLSWWLPGLTSAADWIGSSVDWFPPEAPGLSLSDYLQQARLKARRAVAEAGVLAPDSRNAPPFSFALRPLQQAVTAAALPNGPILAFLEDETGSGKTEAALILAGRMLAAGKARGLYLALPTMATADAMFPRVAEVLTRLFATPPALTLAHGRARLSVPFRDLVARGVAQEDEPGCSEFLAQSSRRALFAPVGVGTIDQALLAVLKARWNTLRLYGLSGKILIVDEVHEMGDPYMGQCLEALLEVQAALGGSAILLSATLPLPLRNRLRAAFARGLGVVPQPDPGTAYPALTVMGAGGELSQPVAARPAHRGPVRVRRLPTPEAALDHLSAASAQGAVCCWVRNSVDEAIAAVEALRARGLTADLLHARFSLWDRKRHEARILAAYGRNRGAEPGRILVATQVVESSLDLDFDVMVSDLAPMAALIQRAGRLWRHTEERPTRPVPGPELAVVSPDPESCTARDWLSALFEGGAWVYALPDQWRTAKVLFTRGVIDAPSGLRGLIEAVHGEGAEAVPEALERAEIERLGKDMSERVLATQNTLTLGETFMQSGSGGPDTDFPTRLGQETRVLMLAGREKVDSCQLLPLASLAGFSGTPTDAAQLSEVSVSFKRLKSLPLPEQSSPEIAAFTADWPERKRKSVTVCPLGPNGEICAGLTYDAERGVLFGAAQAPPAAQLT